MCIEANIVLPEDIKNRINQACDDEDSSLGRQLLAAIRSNYELAESERIPICQDTGMACVFVSLGQDIFIDGNLEEAIHEGVRQGYQDGFLRKSVVSDPLKRVNSGDNTPAIIYYDIVPGENLRLTVAPKGFGSENMSKIAMLKPSDGADGVKDFVIRCVREAGPNPCPPIVVGVGIGGTFDRAALLAKNALMRSIDVPNPDADYAAMEKELLQRINQLGIGPQVIGGKTTALAVNIETMATHIAGLPVAVNINCHVTRHLSTTL